MIKTLLFLLDNVPVRSKDIDIARGRHKFPETWSEFIRYIKFRIKA